MISVGVINTGVGNIGSVVNMLSYVGANPIVIDRPGQKTFNHLVLPGVGSFDKASRELQDAGFGAYISEHVDSGRKLLGMCLGMQLLLDRSEEGVLPGLGLIRGHCERLDGESEKLKVPHMGWNWIGGTRDSVLTDPDGKDQKFYFTHSYHAVNVPEENVYATTSYGTPIVAAIGNESVLGVQFHPEKSHHYGLALFERFLRWEV